MHASLPMYDPPHLRAANNDFWAAIRAALPFDAPAKLTRDTDLWELWESPDMLFSQTCGLPYRTRLHGNAHIVATPDYGLHGCPPGHYHSTIVTRAGDTPRAGYRLAYNDAMSQSGWAAAQGYGFTSHLETGAHAASLKAISEGKADVALIDSQTLEIIGLPGGLATHGTTNPTPGLVYITARAEWVAPLRTALQSALTELNSDIRHALGIKGIALLDAAAYLAVPNPAAP